MGNPLTEILACMDQMLADPALDALAFDKDDSRVIRTAIVAAIRQGEGMARDTEPYAIHVLAGYFDTEVGEWVYSVQPTPLWHPYTHWWPLPDLAATLPPPAPDERDRWPADAKFHMGDLAQKKQRSKWRGPICGFYSTSQTPIGYVVEGQYETGSVQAWPEAALIAWDAAPDERDDEVSNG